MITLDKLTKAVSEYLDPDTMKEYCPNGLQVEGAGEVKKVVTGVSACMELFEAAKERNSEAVIVHHGIIWNSGERTIKGSMRERVKYLLQNDISLLAYHLPLDRHPEVGNNAQIAKALGLEDLKSFGDYNGKAIGWTGVTGGPRSAEEFMDVIRSAINGSASFHAFGPDTVEKVAVCSGGCQHMFHQAIKEKVDLFLTGEESEWIFHLAKEEGIHYAAAGHHATERFGPIALGEWISENLEVDVEFVDIHNPL